MTRLFFLILALFLPLGSSAKPAVALFYGHNAPLSELKLFDIAVVEPDQDQDPVAFRKTGSEMYAYVSVAEVQHTRTYYSEIPSEWKMARNGAWNSEVIDQTPAKWPDFFATNVIGPLWKQGYRGFFLDTLDSYRLAAKFDEQAQQDGLVRVIDLLHTRYPGIRLILNRGFEIVPRVKDKIQMVAAESLYQSWNPGAQRYEPVKPEDRAWLLGQLNTIHAMYGLPILAIDYVDPSDRSLTRKTADQIKLLGFIPWVTDGLVQTVGIGSIEVVPRHVLVLYYGGESPSLNYTAAHRYLQLPLNHMGYVVDYVDVRNALPESAYRDRYAGIVTYFSGFIPADRSTSVKRWLIARIKEKMPLAVMGSFGFSMDSELTALLGTRADIGLPEEPQSIVAQDVMMGFETSVGPGTEAQFMLVNDVDGKPPARTHPLIEFKDAENKTLVGGALMPWGGFLVDPFVVKEIPGTDYARWVVDPFAFLTQTLHLQPFPIPDVTTENGRRLLFSHVDGDGFASRAEFRGSPFAADVLMKDIFQKYRDIPQTMSVIEAEISPGGLHPDLSPELEGIAKRMFLLPHVELASHTYSHPFEWDSTVTGAMKGLDIPGYTVSLEREIVGSTDYINSRLAPPGKKVKILLWPGEADPSAEAIAITQKAGLLNMNGGDTSITHTHPSLTNVGAFGIRKDGYLQVYAPITNENIYTNLWHGPYYGYEQVLQSFDMTERPRRLKPVDIYYHVYSASKRASLLALHKVYDWAESQPLNPVFASEFIRKVQDFYTYAIAQDDGGWRVRGNGELRTLRLPPALGVPVMESNEIVAGYRKGTEGVYVHLADGAGWFRTQSQQDATSIVPRRPYLFDSNGRLDKWRVSHDGRSIEFSLHSHAPIAFGVAAGGTCRVHANRRALNPISPTAGLPANIQQFRISDVAAEVKVDCPVR